MREQAAFEAVGRLSEAAGRPGQPLVAGLFSRWTGAHGASARDWSADADWAISEQEPVRARALLLGLLAVVMALIAWAAYAPLDEVTRGDGRVVPSRQLQVIQSFDGGVVDESFVREGQIVEAGELLMRIDPTRFLSSLRENQSQHLTLQVKAARLQALLRGTDFEPPPELAGRADAIVANERQLYERSREAVREQVAITRQQLTQREEEVREATSRLEQAERTLALARRELDVTRPLLRSGAVSEVEVLRLERDVSDAQGRVGQTQAQIARLRSAITEARGKMREVELTATNRWRAELAETLGKLSSLSESSLGLADRVKHAEIRAPVRGTVQRVFANTPGAVVQPGRDVLEIVPLDDQLLVEARVAPRDIAFLRPGQAATVKFAAYEFATYGGMQAQVEHISADTVTDDRDNTYYVVRVRTQEADFAGGLPIIPGMTAQVDVLTGKKTVLAYLLKPVLRARANALTER